MIEKRVWVINHSLALCRADAISLGAVIEKKFMATHAPDNRHITGAGATRAAGLVWQNYIFPHVTLRDPAAPLLRRNDCTLVPLFV